MLAARGRAVGPGAPPLLVVGPRPLRRVLAAQAALEPLAFTFVDCCHTEVGGPFGARCSWRGSCPHSVYMQQM